MSTELLDPACVPDTFCEGVGKITQRGDNFRVTLFAERDRGDGDIERLVVAQLVWSREDLQRAARQIKAALDGKLHLGESARPDHVMLS